MSGSRWKRSSWSNNEVILAEAIKKELARGGQVYYLHNRVDNIESTAARVRPADGPPGPGWASPTAR